MYYCKECQKPVLVLPEGKVMKNCKCDAPVIAEMKATVYSHSRLQMNGKPIENAQRD